MAESVIEVPLPKAPPAPKGRQPPVAMRHRRTLHPADEAAAMKQLEFTTLRLFAAVAEAGSLSAAAEKSNIAVAAVSKRISDLESSTGSQFFHRHARGMTLTPAGRALLQHARQILFGVDRMHMDLSQYALGAKGLVRVSPTTPTVLSGSFTPRSVRMPV